jgi:hypothetical protein
MSYDELIAALKSFFGDTTRSAAETKAGLQGLIDEAEMLRDSIAAEE